MQVFLCGVCGPVGGSWFCNSSYQRRPLELLHVWTTQHLRFTAEKRRLAQQTTALLRQQPWTGVCEYLRDFRHPSKFWQWKCKGLQSIMNCLNWNCSAVLSGKHKILTIYCQNLTLFSALGTRQVVSSSFSRKEKANQSSLSIRWHCHGYVSVSHKLGADLVLKVQPGILISQVSLITETSLPMYHFA